VSQGNVEALLVPPASLDELDIPSSLVTDIILRYFFNYGNATGNDVQQIIRLPFKLVDETLARLQQEHMLEVRRGTGGLGRRGYMYAITDEGKNRARDAFERAQYIGPAPIPVEQYNQAILRQTRKETISPERVQQALSHLILPPDFHRRIVDTSTSQIFSSKCFQLILGRPVRRWSKYCCSKSPMNQPAAPRKALISH